MTIFVEFHFWCRQTVNDGFNHQTAHSVIVIV
jgi:hypothetical protein